jgi:hypothetical protein
MRLTNNGSNAPVPQPRTEGERELARALALLQSDDTGPVTLAALRERGVRAPAQAMYDLRLAGHKIDRVTATNPSGHGTSGYHLCGPAQPAPDQPAELRVEDDILNVSGKHEEDSEARHKHSVRRERGSGAVSR